jgi:N utilization substance protein A
MRVQSIIRELRGEKIDIIEYNEEITTFAEKALQPAKVSRVSIVDLADKQLEVIVDDTQLSLAIGKKGQNVRLAAKLLGWKIDIKSEEEKRQEVEQQMSGFSSGPSTPIEAVSELGESIIQKLVAAGITTVESLADMTPEQLEEIPGIGEKTLERISVAVRHYFGQYEEGETNPNAAAETSDTSGDEVVEPGTPEEPVEEATAELKPESKQDDAGTESMEVENAADPERTHPVEPEDVVPAHELKQVSPEAVLEDTQKTEEASIDQVNDLGEERGDA